MFIPLRCMGVMPGTGDLQTPDWAAAPAATLPAVPALQSGVYNSAVSRAAGLTCDVVARPAADGLVGGAADLLRQPLHPQPVPRPAPARHCPGRLKEEGFASQFIKWRDFIMHLYLYEGRTLCVRNASARTARLGGRALVHPALTAGGALLHTAAVVPAPALPAVAVRPAPRPPPQSLPPPRAAGCPVQGEAAPPRPAPHLVLSAGGGLAACHRPRPRHQQLPRLAGTS